MTPAEFSRPVRIDTIGDTPRTLSVEANEEERQELASRFGLVALDQLAADLSLRRQGADVVASGRFVAKATQSCIASGEPVESVLEDQFEILFRPEHGENAADEEVELGESEMDIVFYDGGAVDVGEAVAETLALALDPYPRAPGAEAALKAAGVKSEEEAGPFGALAGLRDKLKR